jgi:hypothetical protein
VLRERGRREERGREGEGEREREREREIERDEIRDSNIRDRGRAGEGFEVLRLWITIPQYFTLSSSAVHLDTHSQ